MAAITERNLAPAAKAESSSIGSWTPANPAPLGLGGFAITTLTLSFINANIVGSGAQPVVLGMALAFGGIAQLLAGMWEFRNGNQIGAVAFSAYGAFWISFFVLVSYDAKLIAPASEVGSGLGLYLIMWGVFSAMMFLCTFTAPRVLTGVFALLTVTFVLLGVGQAGSHSRIIHLGGYFGIVTGALALYLACAELMEGVYGRSILPIGKPRAAA